MRYQINGLDRESGKTREVWLDAESEELAIQGAGDLGIVVESVKLEAAQPLLVYLDKRQLRMLRVSEFKIAVGVFLGLFLWAIVWGAIMLLFMGSIIGAASV